VKLILASNESHIPRESAKQAGANSSRSGLEASCINRGYRCGDRTKGRILGNVAAGSCRGAGQASWGVILHKPAVRGQASP
jgi:hypothetical protein